MTAASGTVLVTGADGFIGTALCRQLTEAGYPLRTLTRSRALPAGSAVNANAFVTPDFSGDIRDRALLERALTGVRVVFHLAGVAHVDGASEQQLQAVNVEGTAAVAAAALAAGVERLVYFSSSLAVAAEQDAPTQTAYGRSKFEAEQRLLEIARNSSLKVTILRPVNVYGPGMKGNLAAMVRLIGRGRMPPLPRLDTRLSLVGLEDLCRAALLAADDRADFATYLVTDGLTYALNEIEASIYRALGKPAPRWRSPRVLFYLAAVAAGLLSRVGLSRTSLGVRTYRNLVTENLHSNQPICDALGFTPHQSFYTDLPELLDVK